MHSFPLKTHIYMFFTCSSEQKMYTYTLRIRRQVPFWNKERFRHSRQTQIFSHLAYWLSQESHVYKKSKNFQQFYQPIPAYKRTIIQQDCNWNRNMTWGEDRNDFGFLAFFKRYFQPIWGIQRTWQISVFVIKRAIYERCSGHVQSNQK